MLDKIPNEEEMTALLGKSLYDVWHMLCALIDKKYDMDCLWASFAAPIVSYAFPQESWS